MSSINHNQWELKHNVGIGHSQGGSIMYPSIVPKGVNLGPVSSSHFKRDPECQEKVYRFVVDKMGPKLSDDLQQAGFIKIGEAVPGIRMRDTIVSIQLRENPSEWPDALVCGSPFMFKFGFRCSTGVYVLNVKFADMCGLFFVRKADELTDEFLESDKYKSLVKAGARSLHKKVKDVIRG